MSPLPTMSLRCLPEHQSLVRDIARQLRTRPGLAAAVGALLAEDAATVPAPSPAVTDLVARLEAVEHWIAERNAAVLRPDEAPTPPTDTATTDGEATKGDTEDAGRLGAVAGPGGAPTGQQPASDANRAAIVRAARKAKGWTQAELADKAGLSLPTVSRLEGGKVAGVKAWGKIAAALGINPPQCA